MIPRSRHHDYGGVDVRRGINGMAKNWIIIDYKSMVATAHFSVVVAAPTNNMQSK
jgi:hypothetical protein